MRPEIRLLRQTRIRGKLVSWADLFQGTVARPSSPQVISINLRGRSEFPSARRTCSVRIVGCSSFLCSRFAPAVA
jgi:hypothetical protein